MDTRRPPRKPDKAASGDAAERVEWAPLPRGVPEELDRMAGRAMDAKWFLGHAIAALRDGDTALALEHGARAKDAALRSPTVRETLGLAAYAAADFKQALAELLAFRRMTGSRIQDARIADCYRGVGRPMRAVEFLDEAGAPADPAAAARVRAGALHDAGDDAGARSAMKAAGLPDQAPTPAGSLPLGSVGSTAGSPRRKSGTRSGPRSGR